MSEEQNRPAWHPSLTLYDFDEIEKRVSRATFSAGLKLTAVWFVLYAVGMVLLAALSGRT